MAHEGLVADYEPTSRDSGLVVPSIDRSNRITAEDMGKIRELALDGAYLEEQRIFGFDAIASTDALDSYFTRPHVERALALYVDDLKTGTSVLGNHDYRTWSVGQSFDGELVDVAGRDSFVKGFEAKKGARGRYYTVRDLEMSGQRTNDIIQAMQYGIARRVSVTFLPQRYECNLDGKDMMAWECEHFPGVRYGDNKDLCWAWIMDSRLLETSLVFRNASPDAMLQRKIAEGIAQGEIPQGQLAYIAQRFALPTPTATRFVFQRKEEAVVEDKEKREGDPAEQPATPPADPPKADAAEEGKPEDEPGDGAAEGGEGAGDEEGKDEGEGKDEKKPEPEPEAAKPLTADERATALAAILDTAEDGELAGLAGRFEDHFARKGAKLPGTEAAAAREAQVRGALGIDEHADIVAAATEAKRKSGMADDLFGDLVTRTVKARISAGFTFSEDAYRRQLTNSQDVEFVRSELASHEEARKDRWKPGRVIEPGDAEAVPPAEDQPQRHDPNVLETLTPRGDKGRSKSPAYAVPAKKS